ncbi:MAG: hypothetical protein PW792_11810 [Acidobacteriaceae bacterium]|nr:hypothetical protein [Acidobacteriaceae bacterium]
MAITHRFGAPSPETPEELEKLLQEAETSGEPIEMTQQEWDRLRDEVRHEAEKRRKAS